MKDKVKPYRALIAGVVLVSVILYMLVSAAFLELYLAGYLTLLEAILIATTSCTVFIIGGFIVIYIILFLFNSVYKLFFQAE